MKKAVHFTFLILLISISVFAQSPKGINYQAVARTSGGEAMANKEIKVRISIVKDSNSSLTEYRETHNVTTNDYGLFSLVIGNGSSGMKLANVDWAGSSEKWLKIEMDVTNSGQYTLIGNQQLMSVPYALYADEAAEASAKLKVMNEEEIVALEDPEVGLMVLNSTTNRLNYFGSDGWYAIPSEKIAGEFSCGELLLDSRDGKTYRTVLIGNQCWMAENLNVGTRIVGSASQLDNEVIEKYCYQDNEAGCDYFGGLYQWSELMDYQKFESGQGICPEGWHVPSDSEVNTLEIALGMDADQAQRSNVWRGTDQGLKMAPGGSSGYELLYGGRRVTGGLYTASNSYEYLWTSSQSGSDAWRRCFEVDEGKIGRYDTFPKTYGMSVRCVKN